MDETVASSALIRLPGATNQALWTDECAPWRSFKGFCGDGIILFGCGVGWAARDSGIPSQACRNIAFPGRT